MSALPPKADIAENDWHVRFVPEADIGLLAMTPFSWKNFNWRLLTDAARKRDDKIFDEPHY